ncbi:MAG TPA: ComF family protein [Opitutaceae bacterium]|nr:ComF family protein [Opitutaceae bacterium]
MNASGAIAEFWRTAGDLLFPPVCVHCGGLVEGGALRHLCPRCERLVVVVRPPCCRICGHPFAGEAAGGRTCMHCAELEPLFREGRTCVLLRGPGRALVHALKYHHAPHVLEDMAVLIRAAGVADHVRGAVLVPVPLHPRKERERGYNQSRLLAECLAAAAGGTTRVAEPLRRVVDTPTQTRLDRRTRQGNLKNAFALRGGAGINAADRYVLVDDVFTTGSTLNACAAVLRRAGALNLDVVTFGHG